MEFLNIDPLEEFTRIPPRKPSLTQRKGVHPVRPGDRIPQQRQRHSSHKEIKHDGTNWIRSEQNRPPTSSPKHKPNTKNHPQDNHYAGTLAYLQNNFLHTWIFLVPGEGVEPSLPCGNWILNPARLPIPPSGHLKRDFKSGKILDTGNGKKRFTGNARKTSIPCRHKWSANLCRICADRIV